MPSNHLYQSNITTGSLKIRESRIVADLLIKNVSPDEWNIAIIDQNVLQVRNLITARKYSNLIKQRLNLMTPELWELIRDGSLITATHATLAAAIKHSRLLGDFLHLVIRDHHRMFKPKLSNTVWNDFLYDCQGRDPHVETWNESTRSKLKRSVYHILTQSGYLESTRSLTLQPVHISPEVIRYLIDKNETYILDCMQVTP